ncbi:MAG: hypothetical protein Fur0037_18640 [Planctomycetota bacterium]
MRLLTSSSILVLLASGATAQQFVGFAYHLESGATSRGAIAAGAGETIARFDAGDYAGWANDPVNPAQRSIQGISCIVQDQDAVTTPELFDVRIYSEDPANPGYPLISSGVVAATGVSGPTPPASGVVGADYHSLTFATPVAMPVGSDVFVAFTVPANAGWFATDGLSFHVSLGYQPNPSFLSFDLPGAAMQPFISSAVPPSNSYALSRSSATGIMAYSPRRQMIVDIVTPGSGGCVTASTNQASYASSNGPEGTASFLSGLHPDLVNPPANPGRADNLGYRFENLSLPDGSLVFFLMTAGAFGPEIPLAGAIPGSEGVLCLNLPGTRTTGIGFTVLGEAIFTMTVPAPARSALSGLSLLQQAVAIDVTTGFLHGAPCGRQRL